MTPTLAILSGLSLAACGGGTGTAPAAAATPAHDHTAAPATADPTVGAVPVPTDAVAIVNFTFSPPVITVKAGTRVTWTNQDQDAHNIAIKTGTPFTSAPMQKGESASHVFDTPGSYPYVCGFHPFMHGMVVVT